MAGSARAKFRQSPRGPAVVFAGAADVVRAQAVSVKTPGLHCSPAGSPEWFRLGNEADHLVTARSELGEPCSYGEDSGHIGVPCAPRKETRGRGWSSSENGKDWKEAVVDLSALQNNMTRLVLLAVWKSLL